MRKIRRAAVFSLALLAAARMAATRVAVAQAPIIYRPEDTAALDIALIRDGALVTNLNFENPRGVIARYTGVDLGEAPQTVTCRARFDGGGAVALISSAGGAWSIDGITKASIHAVFTSESYHFGFFEDGVLSDVLAGEYTLDRTGGKEYTFGYTISGTTLTLKLPNGKTDKKIDERVKALNGPYVIFEHYLTAEDVAAGAAPAIVSVYAKGKSLPALKDDFQRGDGLPFIAPSGHVYVQFRNEWEGD